MRHLTIMRLLNSLSESKKILQEIEQYDDYQMIELLEMKYEKMYEKLSIL